MRAFLSSRWLKKILVAGGILAVLCCALVLAVLNSPLALGSFAGLFGYDVTAESVSFSPFLSGSAKNLRISGPEGSGLALICDNVTANNSLNLLLKGHIDTLILEKPKLAFRIGKKKTDLTFLNKLPNVTLLDIRNAEAVLSFEGSEQNVTLRNFNFTLKNFSPSRGGDLLLESLFSFAESPRRQITAAGSFKAALKLAGAYPPYGTGTAELLVDEGTYALEGKRIALQKLQLKTDLAFDKKTDTLTVRSITGGSKQFGSIHGTAKAVLRGSTPWSASIAVSSIDFAEVFTLARPALPEEYGSWTMQGKGAVETNLNGTYAKERLSLNGTLSFSFSKGGFSSPDAAKAAQDVSGKVILRLQYGGEAEKLAFTGRSELAGGEFLWEKLYSNLAGRNAGLTLDGSFFLPQKRLQLAAQADFFGIATSSLTFEGTSLGWKAGITDTVIRNDLVVSLLLKDFLEYASPVLKGASATGTTALSAALERSAAGTAVRGMLTMTDTSLHAPERSASIDSLSAAIPIWLLITPDGKPVKRPDQFENGAVSISGFRKGKLHIEKISVPLLVSLNYARVSAPVSIPLFGGDVVLYRLGLDDLPHPALGFRLGIRLENIDLGQMTRELIDDEYAGVVFADTGILRYRNERLQGDGQFLIRVFGGEISFENFFFEKMFSKGRRIGADVVFSGISLEQVTQKVPIGHMTGIIRGSLKNFVMEYGQPASFDLEVQSVETPGVSQRFSMDAIESITVLGTGVKTSVKGGLTSLFREFPYSQIGFRCTLRNDEFTIRGTVESGGKEYLVKRGWLRGVDIVNQNRDNTISFQDMQERLRRVMDSERPSPGGPEVEH